MFRPTNLSAYLAVLVGRQEIPGWLADLLSENAQRSRLGMPRVSPMFNRIADTGEEDHDAREEIKALRAALQRLASEHVDEALAVDVLLTQRRVPDDLNYPACVAGLQRVGRWVDEAMGD